MSPRPVGSGPTSPGQSRCSRQFSCVTGDCPASSNWRTCLLRPRSDQLTVQQDDRPSFQFQLPIMATATIQAPIVIIRIRPTQYAIGFCSRAFWAPVPDSAPMRPGITDDQISTITLQIMNNPTMARTSVLIVSIIFASNLSHQTERKPVPFERFSFVFGSSPTRLRSRIL